MTAEPEPDGSIRHETEVLSTMSLEQYAGLADAAFELYAEAEDKSEAWRWLDVHHDFEALAHGKLRPVELEPEQRSRLWQMHHQLHRD